MAVPDPIQVPEVPLRTAGGRFLELREAFLPYFPELQEYMAAVCDLTEDNTMAAEHANDPIDAADLDLTPVAGKILSVNPDGDDVISLDYGPAIAFASRSSALVGENNERAMTALRTKEAIDKFVPETSGWERIAEKTASNSPNLAFLTEFDSSKYVDYRIVVRNLVPFSDGEIRLMASSDGGRTSNLVTHSGDSAGTNRNWAALSSLRDVGSVGVDEPGLCGILDVYGMHGDFGCHFTFRGVFFDVGQVVRRAVISGTLQKPSANQPVNFLRFFAEDTNLDTGSVTLYGLTGESAQAMIDFRTTSRTTFRTTSRTTSWQGGTQQSRSTSHTTSRTTQVPRFMHRTTEVTEDLTASLTTRYQTEVSPGETRSTSHVTSWQFPSTFDRSTTWTANVPKTTSYSTSYTTYYTEYFSGSRVTSYLTFDE